MHIALLTDGMYPYSLGGMQMHSYYLTKYFAKNQVHVHLYHPAINIKQEEFLSCFTENERKYIQVFFVDVPASIYFPGHYIYESYHYSKNVYLKYLENEHVDFIYAQGFSAWELIRLKKQGDSSIAPIGVNFHGLNMFQPAFGLKNLLNNFLFRPSVKFNLKHADYVFSLGKSLTKLISENIHGVKKIIEISVGIDNSWIIEEHEIKNNDVLSFVFIGRYDRVKGINLLNNAIQNLIKNDLSFVFNFIGPFPAEFRLDHQNIIYHGEIRDAVILKSIIKESDIIVSSSYSEGMPTVIIEAMACGLAVIATNVGAVSELVDEKNGRLISPGNAEDIETSMMEFIQLEKGRLLSMKKNSITKVNERFLWDKIIVQTINEIKKIID